MKRSDGSEIITRGETLDDGDGLASRSRESGQSSDAAAKKKKKKEKIQEHIFCTVDDGDEAV